MVDAHNTMTSHMRVIKYTKYCSRRGLGLRPKNEQNGCARLIPVPYWHVYEWRAHSRLNVDTLFNLPADSFASD